MPAKNSSANWQVWKNLKKSGKIIGKGFIDVFDEEAHKIKDVKWLAQGTIYPDCIESLSITGTVIKSHHNVGGLPEKMNLNYASLCVCYSRMKYAT